MFADLWCLALFVLLIFSVLVVFGLISFRIGSLRHAYFHKQIIQKTLMDFSGLMFLCVCLFDVMFDTYNVSYCSA